MIPKSLLGIFGLACVGSLLGACAMDVSEEDDAVVRAKTQPLNADRHRRAARMGVAGWVLSSSDLADRFEEASRNGDTGTWSDGTPADDHSDSHFDNCYWKKSIERMRSVMDLAVDYAVAWGNNHSTSNRDKMIENLGYALHLVQDHYAHSNWVETHSSGIVSDFSSTTPPSDWFSGTYYNPEDTGPRPSPCDLPLATTHSAMNKDKPGVGDPEEALMDAAISTSELLESFEDAVRDRLGTSSGDSLLAALGFSVNPPSTLRSRSDYQRSLTLSGSSWGVWSAPTYCEAGSYVAAFRQKVEAQQGSDDDTALNAVTFYCRSKATGQWTSYLNPWEGMWGTVSGWSYASSGSPITGGELKAESAQGSGDDTALNAARFWAKDGTFLAASNDQKWGSWRGSMSCPSGEAVCGVRVQVEAPIAGEDDTSMNGLRLYCCIY